MRAKLMLAAVAFLAACSGGGHEAPLAGQWAIEAYLPVEKSSYGLAPTDVFYRFEFDADGAFFCGTDCNSFSGVYVQRGDSLTFDNIACTEMACDNETLERAVRHALPAVRTVEQRADTALLKDAGGYTIMKLVKK